MCSNNWPITWQQAVHNLLVGNKPKKYINPTETIFWEDLKESYIYPVFLELMVVKSYSKSPNSKGGILMTKQQKEIVKQLRSEGKGYGKISEIVKLSKSTISSYCKTLEKEASFCLTCSAKLKQTGGHRQKKYCSDSCRSKYWKLHKSEIKRNPNHIVKCSFCHKEFLTFKSLKRKYCSWDCFLKSKVRKDQ